MSIDSTRDSGLGSLMSGDRTDRHSSVDSRMEEDEREDDLRGAPASTSATASTTSGECKPPWYIQPRIINLRISLAIQPANATYRLGGRYMIRCITVIKIEI